MHISEGVLTAPILVTGAVTAVSGVAVGLKSMKDCQIPKVAIVTAALFVAALIHVPLGPTSVHLVLNGIAGIILGWQVFPAFLVALVLQLLLFQFGGLTVLGVNVVLMATPAIICYYLFKSVFNLSRQQDSTYLLGGAAFICGGLAIVISTLIMAGVLMLAEDSFLQLARVIIVSHLPVLVIEAVLSMLVVVFLLRVKPQLLEEF
ncbi:cobalt transporter CbiM [Fuchsiella alkaliacetigena]|uniref:cobalt transporter CbiM n=1 Tax=Fuchsiella alkaliacetigena TaxID=957042 RepID=UPI00200A753F|nr:cobalt transporter CbiM [Fuchsiella alkaliacetigena]MCK8823635.1 cobalt transporter CbiM [Fuchsiella alkaliacetigena]